MQKGLGPQCVASQTDAYIDRGTMARAKFNAPGNVTGMELTEAERETLLDITQVLLDITGIVDPSPVSDGSNVAISLVRADWVGAGISTLSLIPYVGDLAKAGKLGRWAQTLHKAVEMARASPQFARAVRPLAVRLTQVMNMVPSTLVPSVAEPILRRVKSKLKDLTGLLPRAAKHDLVATYRAKWVKRIEEIQLSAPGKDRGALWSKLGPKEELHAGFAKNGDATEIAGDQLAAMLARQDGKVTLEMSLQQSRFAEELGTDIKAIEELLGTKLNWDDLAKELWENVSTKFARQLEGRVTVYVDDLVLKQAIQQGNYPILTKELKELFRRMSNGEGVTEVVIKDIFDGTTFVAKGL